MTTNFDCMTYDYIYCPAKSKYKVQLVGGRDKKQLISSHITRNLASSRPYAYVIRFILTQQPFSYLLSEYPISVENNTCEVYDYRDKTDQVFELFLVPLQIYPIFINYINLLENVVSPKTISINFQEVFSRISKVKSSHGD